MFILLFLFKYDMHDIYDLDHLLHFVMIPGSNLPSNKLHAMDQVPQ